MKGGTSDWGCTSGSLIIGVVGGILALDPRIRKLRRIRLEIPNRNRKEPRKAPRGRGPVIRLIVMTCCLGFDELLLLPLVVFFKVYFGPTLARSGSPNEKRI